LSVQKARIGAARNAIRERTYHNYVVELNAFGNFRVDQAKIADTDIRDIGPKHFSDYAATFLGWKASGFDSVVSRVSALFRWAVEMEYVDRFRPGPDFRRPEKKVIRSDRIELSKSFSPTDIAKLYLAANDTVRCWIALGVCAAFNNSDIGNLPRDVIDWKASTIDYRRRKTGKIRRVIPLPPDVLAMLRKYRRPADPVDAAHADLFFLTSAGLPFTRTKSRDGEYKPSDSVSRLFAKLMSATGTKTYGRNFSGLRTTFYNLAPRGEWDVERKIIMGHAQGSIDLDSYLEDVGVDRLAHVVNHVWNIINSAISTERQDAIARKQRSLAASAPGGDDQLGETTTSPQPQTA
jgi:integrase